MIGDDDRGDEHAAPAADGEAEIPAGEIARDDRADAERPKACDPRIAAQAPLLEIGGVNPLIT